MSRDEKAICLLLRILRYIFSTLKLQRICLRHKDIKEAKRITDEIIKWIEELGLDK